MHGGKDPSRLEVLVNVWERITIMLPRERRDDVGDQVRSVIIAVE